MNLNTSLIIKPIITEKSLKLASEENQYSFVVKREASKIEIGKIVKKLWSVEPIKVTTQNIKGKRVRFGRNRKQGSRSDHKKAVVTLKSGDKIALFEVK